MTTSTISSGRKNGKLKEAVALRLDLGCGQNKKEGFTGVDFKKCAGVDIVHDLFKFPFPFKDNSVDEIHTAHFFEHIPGEIRGKFMDECYRILKPEGKMTVICPYWSSMRSIQDFTHAWPPVCEASFLYFNKVWRDQNKLDHYGLSCNFDFNYGYSLAPHLQVRPEEYRTFSIGNYVNSVMDVQVNLIKR